MTLADAQPTPFPLERLLFALGLAGLGALSLLYRDFAVIWQPVPESLPWHKALAVASGVVLLAGGLGLMAGRAALASAWAMAVYLLIAWVLPQAVKTVPEGSGFVGRWLGFFETLVPLCGCVLLLAALAQKQPGMGLPAQRMARAAPVAVRLALGVACLVFGVSHFLYPVFTAAMIPDWIPARLGLAYLTGVGHFAAGLALVCDVVPGMAIALEALMMTCFVLLVHVPALVADPAPVWAPTARIQWTALCWASAMAGAAWVVAAFLRRPAVHA